MKIKLSFKFEYFEGFAQAIWRTRQTWANFKELSIPPLRRSVWVSTATEARREEWAVGSLQEGRLSVGTSHHAVLAQ